jgi:hypothetical protein
VWSAPPKKSADVAARRPAHFRPGDSPGSDIFFNEKAIRDSVVKQEQ